MDQRPATLLACTGLPGGFLGRFAIEVSWVAQGRENALDGHSGRRISRTRKHRPHRYLRGHPGSVLPPYPPTLHAPALPPAAAGRRTLPRSAAAVGTTQSIEDPVPAQEPRFSSRCSSVGTAMPTLQRGEQESALTPPTDAGASLRASRRWSIGTRDGKRSAGRQRGHSAPPRAARTASLMRWMWPRPSPLTSQPSSK